MPNHPARPKIPPEIRSDLDAYYLRVTAPAPALRAWKRLLTDSERQKLGGSLDQCCRQIGNIVRIWMRLKKVSQPRAILDLAAGLNFLSTADYQWMLCELREKPKPARKSKLPQWDRTSRQLRFEGSVIRRIRSLKVASTIVAILDAFEDQQWPWRIASPVKSSYSTQRAHDAVYTLNKGLKKISFHVDGDGDWLRWSRSR